MFNNACFQLFKQFKVIGICGLGIEEFALGVELLVALADDGFGIFVGDAALALKNVLVLESVGAGDDAAADLVVEGAAGQSEFPGELAEGEPVLLGQAEVPVVDGFDVVAHGAGDVLAGGMVDVVVSGHGRFLSGYGLI